MQKQPNLITILGLYWREPLGQSSISLPGLLPSVPVGPSIDTLQFQSYQHQLERLTSDENVQHKAVFIGKAAPR